MAGTRAPRVNPWKLRGVARKALRDWNKLDGWGGILLKYKQPQDI